jgi:DNA-binding NarL/FixJ family response regulator
MTIRVLLCDDQALVRDGFRMILNAEDDIDVVGEAADGGQAVEATKRLRPKVVLMDVRMPGIHGIEATRRILVSGVDSRVLILTTFDLDEYVYQALRAGASGFLLKDATAPQLVEGVRVVAAGEGRPLRLRPGSEKDEAQRRWARKLPRPFSLAEVPAC